MHECLARLVRTIPLTGRICLDVVSFLSHHGYTKTLEHCRAVAAEAGRLARQFGVDRSLAQSAGWLHDVSAVFPVAQRLPAARDLGVDVLPEEKRAPMLLHQKLSAVMAKEVFGLVDRTVLSAIECHTTLKAGASALDKIVFVADKIAWDQPGVPPYSAEIAQALRRSLDQAALCYLDHLWQRRDRLLAVHPWFVEAHKELVSRQAAE